MFTGVFQIVPRGPLNAVFANYAKALALVAVGTLVRFFSQPVLGQSTFAITLVTVLTAAWVGGLAPTLLAQTLVLFIEALVFGRESGEPFDPTRAAVGGGVFYFVGIVVALLSEFASVARQRAKSESELAVSQGERLKATLACMGDGVLVTDSTGRLTMMNPVAEAMIGRTMAECIGQPLDDVFQVVDEQTSQRKEAVPEHLLLHGPIIRSSSRVLLVTANRPPLPINYSAAPVRDSTGSMTGVVVVLHDQTQQRQIEQELREADRRKDEFLATLAHELRNPLAPITTGLELLKISDDRQAVEETRATMERQTRHMVRLIDDLLDVSRITRGKLQLKRCTVSLHEVITSAVDAARPLIDELGHELTLSAPKEQVLLNADSARLIQLISNLLNNAARFTPRGGCLGLDAIVSGNDLQIGVSDTGVGIPSEMHERIFDMFCQINRSANGVSTGLGIGLTLVKSLVELHDGTVTVQSGGDNQGSRFVVRLPVVLSIALSEPVSSTATAEMNGAACRVLVADDNSDALETLSRLIRMLGHQVRTASDGAEAVDVAEEFQPEIVFMDLGMPRVDGYEAARRIRRLLRGSEMYLVAVTGWGRDQDRTRSREAGFDYHVVKPIELCELKRAFVAAQSSESRLMTEPA